MAKNYYNLPYTGKSEITIEDFLSKKEGVYWNMTYREFLDYLDDNGDSNLEKIYRAYPSTLQQQTRDMYSGGDLDIILPNTELSIPKEKTFIEQSLLYGDNQLRDQTPSRVYWSENYKKLLLSDGYFKSDSLTSEGRGFDVQVINQKIRVWVWIRAVDKIINISPFVSNLNTSKGEEGSFNIILDPVHDLNKVMKSGNTYINYFNLSDSENKHVIDFFEKNLQFNDVVFIRFDELQLEKENEKNIYASLDEFEINESLLVGRNWDMIGLLDQSRVSYSAGSTDKFLNLTGKDLTKLLTEDGSYFLPVKFIQNSDKSWIWGGNQEDSWFKRNMISGSYDYYFSYSMKDFKGAIGFVMNQLSNLGVTTQKLWAGYGDKIVKIKDVPSEDTSNIITKEVKGIWQIINLFVEEEQNKRVIADDSLANPDGTLMDYMQKLCQKPFVEFYGDTNGDMFDFVVRQPPFAKEQIRSVLNEGSYVYIEPKDTLGYDLNYDERFYSSYQIEPENTFLGEDANSFLSYIPIIYFNEIAEIYGNRRLVIKDNYISMGSLSGDKANLNLDMFTQLLLPDLQYLIESNSYLPFTRKGIITINRDRRIKKGSFIKLGVTNELFYVTEVSHSASINKSKVDGQTSITVERGMVTDFINEKVVGYDYDKEAEIQLRIAEQVKVSYFSVFDSEFIVKTIQANVRPEQTAPKSRVLTKFGVNKDALNFFLTRKQFK